MAKQLKETGEAVVKDYSNGQDGSKDVKVPYEFEYVELENASEVAEKFSPEQLRNLCNSRLKSTANSAARQKAVAPFAPDPNNPDVIAADMLKGFLKMGVPEDVAKGLVANARAAAGGK